MKTCNRDKVEVLLNELQDEEISVASAADKIMALLPTPEAIKDIEWVGECDRCIGEMQFGDERYGKPTCSYCKDTGTITRQATMGEVLEVFTKLMAIELSLGKSMILLNLDWGEALKVNGGTLRMKEANLTEEGP